MTDQAGHLKNVLITGCSSGIGLALSKILWNSPFRVFATARPNSLPALKAALTEHDKFIIRPLEITDYDQQAKLIEEINSRWGGVDILVNNAGISYRATVEDMNIESEMDQILTNYVGPMNLVRLVLPEMREKRAGKIINVSSVGGMMAMPTMGSYSASKFALEGASESLWYEMIPWGVSVTLIQPGFINSNSFHNVRVPKTFKSNSYSKYYENMGAFVQKLMTRSSSTADSVAQIIVGVINDPNPKLRVQATLDARLFYLLRRLIPRRPYHYLLYRLLPGIKSWVPEKR